MSLISELREIAEGWTDDTPGGDPSSRKVMRACGEIVMEVLDKYPKPATITRAVTQALDDLDVTVIHAGLESTGTLAYPEEVAAQIAPRVAEALTDKPEPGGAYITPAGLASALRETKLTVYDKDGLENLAGCFPAGTLVTRAHGRVMFPDEAARALLGSAADCEPGVYVTDKTLAAVLSGFQVIIRPTHPIGGYNLVNGKVASPSVVAVALVDRLRKKTAAGPAPATDPGGSRPPAGTQAPRSPMCRCSVVPAPAADLETQAMTTAVAVIELLDPVGRGRVVGYLEARYARVHQLTFESPLDKFMAGQR